MWETDGKRIQQCQIVEQQLAVSLPINQQWRYWLQYIRSDSWASNTLQSLTTGGNNENSTRKTKHAHKQSTVDLVQLECRIPLPQQVVVGTKKTKK